MEKLRVTVSVQPCTHADDRRHNNPPTSLYLHLVGGAGDFLLVYP
jgi:hypothetical protein